MVGQNSDDDLANELSKFVANEISPIAKPDLIQWSPSLPKTRSGKIMRRILRKIAAGEIHDLGDTSTLAEPEVVKNLVENKLSLNQNSE
jgi:acetyl-CoA synthetase